MLVTATAIGGVTMSKSVLKRSSFLACVLGGVAVVIACLLIQQRIDENKWRLVTVCLAHNHVKRDEPVTPIGDFSPLMANTDAGRQYRFDTHFHYVIKENCDEVLSSLSVSELKAAQSNIYEPLKAVQKTISGHYTSD